MSAGEDATGFLERTNQGQSFVFALGEVHRQFLWNGVLGGLRNLEPAVTLKAIEAADACGQPAMASLLCEAVDLIGDYEPSAPDSIIARVREIEYSNDWEALGDRYDRIGSDLLPAIRRGHDDLFEQ
jgi:hypothetical protein